MVQADSSGVGGRGGKRANGDGTIMHGCVGEMGEGGEGGGGGGGGARLLSVGSGVAEQGGKDRSRNETGTQ